MSYRSDIYIKIRIKNLLLFTNFLDTYNKKYNEHLGYDGYDSLKYSDSYIYFTLLNWKFYDTYNEVKDIINYISDTEGVAGIAVGKDNAVDYFGDTDDLGMYLNITVEGF